MELNQAEQTGSVKILLQKCSKVNNTNLPRRNTAIVKSIYHNTDYNDYFLQSTFGLWCWRGPWLNLV